MLRSALLARELNEKWAVLNLAQLCSLCSATAAWFIAKYITRAAFQKLITDARNKFENTN